MAKIMAGKLVFELQPLTAPLAVMLLGLSVKVTDMKGVLTLFKTDKEGAVRQLLSHDVSLYPLLCLMLDTNEAQLKSMELADLIALITRLIPAATEAYGRELTEKIMPAIVKLTQTLDTVNFSKTPGIAPKV